MNISDTIGNNIKLDMVLIQVIFVEQFIMHW